MKFWHPVFQTYYCATYHLSIATITYFSFHQAPAGFISPPQASGLQGILSYLQSIWAHAYDFFFFNI